VVAISDSIVSAWQRTTKRDKKSEERMRVRENLAIGNGNDADIDRKGVESGVAMGVGDRVYYYCCNRRLWHAKIVNV